MSMNDALPVLLFLLHREKICNGASDQRSCYDLIEDSSTLQQQGFQGVDSYALSNGTNKEEVADTDCYWGEVVKSRRSDTLEDNDRTSAGTSIAAAFEAGPAPVRYWIVYNEMERLLNGSRENMDTLHSDILDERVSLLHQTSLLFVTKPYILDLPFN